MFELQPQDFEKIESLVRNIDHDVSIIYAMLQGNTPGRIWVDDADAPKAVFIYPQGAFHYIAGRSGNPEFLPTVWDILKNEIFRKFQIRMTGRWSSLPCLKAGTSHWNRLSRYRRELRLRVKPFGSIGSVFTRCVTGET